MTMYAVPVQIWATGDVSLADSIFAKDVSLYNLVYGACLLALCAAVTGCCESLVMFITLHHRVKE